MNQHYFDVPFAFSGDVTAIPDALQMGGTISFTEGWNYNYQRNLSTDPAALPIDRSTMNWLFLQITAALQALQKETIPEFITAAQNGGAAIAYNPQAEVLWSASGDAPFTKFVNILGTTNSNTPSASDVLGTTTGWQVACDPIATSAQATAGTNNASIMTPLLVAQQTALRALLAGNSSQVFNVATATSATQAVPLAQAQALSGTVQGVPTFSATATLTAANAAGSDVVFTGSTASQTLTLPTRASVVALTGVLTGTKIINLSTVAVTVATASGDTFLNPLNNTATSIVLQPGDDLELVTSATSAVWATTGGSALRQFHPLLVAALSGTGAIGVVGGLRNGALTVAAASATATYSADEVVLETALGGTAYKLGVFSQSINLATTGAGGMDTGAAPASGYVALYAIYNPTAGTRALLATNATSAAVGNVYSGANMPSGYTASALVAVLPTNSSSQFVAGRLIDRRFNYATSVAILNSTSGATTQVQLSASTAFPPNAKQAFGEAGATAATAAQQFTTYLSATNTGANTGRRSSGYAPVGGAVLDQWEMLVAGQSIWYNGSVSSGATFFVGVWGYDF